MEKNKYELDVKRLNDRAKSLKLLLEFYEKEDVISVYIYDLIAYLILKYSKEKNTNEKFDNFIIELMFNSIKEKYIDMKLESLLGIIEQIEKHTILEKTMKLLLELYIQNEIDINKEYLNNMEPKKSIVEKFVYKVNYDPTKVDWVDSVHSKMIEEILSNKHKEISSSHYEYQKDLNKIAEETIKQIFTKKSEESKEEVKVGGKKTKV